MSQNREPLLTSQILIIFVEYRDVVGDWQMQPFADVNNMPVLKKIAKFIWKPPVLESLFINVTAPKGLLTLNVPHISKSCIEIKIKAFKVFIKPFQEPQRSVKIKV